MFDTLAVAQQLARGGGARDQAEAIAEAVQQGDSVTSDQFRAGVAELRTEIANLDKRLATQIATVETRLLRWMVGAVFAAASLSGGILAALLRLAG